VIICEKIVYLLVIVQETSKIYFKFHYHEISKIPDIIKKRWMSYKF